MFLNPLKCFTILFKIHGWHWLELYLRVVVVKLSVVDGVPCVEGVVGKALELV